MCASLGHGNARRGLKIESRCKEGRDYNFAGGVVHRVRLATAGLATQRGDTERERAWPNIDQAALLSSCQMARSALQFRARSARTCKIRTGKGERSEPAGKNHTAADPQVSSVHLRSALIRGAKTRPGGLDPHWHRQTAKKIGSYNRNSPVDDKTSHMLLVPWRQVALVTDICFGRIAACV